MNSSAGRQRYTASGKAEVLVTLGMQMVHLGRASDETGSYVEVWRTPWSESMLAGAQQGAGLRRINEVA